MANTVECPVCHGSGMTGVSSCGRCRGAGVIRALPDQDVGDAAAEELVTRVEPKRLRTPTSKLSAAGRKTGKGLSFKR
jgi:hypothetical protein